MPDILHEATPPLAWDDEERPFTPPETAIAWRVRRYTGKPGRPPAVWTPKGVLHIGLDSSLDHLRAAVKNEAGSYRLYPVDKNGRELEPVACIELVAEEEADKRDALAIAQQHHQVSARTEEVPMMLAADMSGRFFDLYERMLTSRDSHDALLSHLLTTLVTTTATIQQSTAQMITAANTTIKVANGVEAIERTEPQLDMDELAARLSETLSEVLTPENEAKTDKSHWIMSLINGPLGMTAMQFITNFANTVTAMHGRPAQAGPSPMQAPAAPWSAGAPAAARPPTRGVRAHTVMHGRDSDQDEHDQDEHDQDEHDQDEHDQDEHDQDEHDQDEHDQDEAHDFDPEAYGQDDESHDPGDQAAGQAGEANGAYEPPDEPEAPHDAPDQADAAPDELGRLEARHDHDTQGRPSKAEIEAMAPTTAKPDPPLPDVLSADDVAAFLGVDRKTVYDYANRGELPHQRLGKRLLFSRQALMAWLAECKPRRANR